LIEGYAAMMRESFSVLDHDSMSFVLLQGIYNGTRRLREIVDDMIDVSLLDNNMLQMNFQPVWINQLFSIAKRELSPAAKERGQTLVIRDFPGSEEMTFGDSERLYQSLKNLLTNAIKYTPDGGAITVDGRTLPGFIEITITDTGIGIDEDDIERIFQRGWTRFRPSNYERHHRSSWRSNLG
jgi:signal transduction histidine kinase